MLQRSLLGLLFVSLCVRCMPNLDSLSTGYGHGGLGGTGPARGGGTTGGSADTGGAGSGGQGAMGGEAGDGASGTTGGTSEGGQSGANEAGQGGEAAVGGTGGTSDVGGRGGSTSTGGTPSTGGTSTAGTSTGGIAGEAGAAGAGPDLPCVDGCALLYVPPYANFSQFFTINLDLSTGVDLSNSILTAHLRAIDFAGTTETIQLYASALPNFNFYNNNNVTAALSTLTSGGTLTMDLTSTGTWDNTKVISIGFLLHGGSPGTTVQVLVEGIAIEVKDDPQGTPNAGPWLFTQVADVNETAAESVPTSYSESNIIFANPYNPVPGTKPTWVPPAN